MPNPRFVAGLAAVTGLLTAVSPSRAEGQAKTAAITGRVTNFDGAPVPGARVVLVTLRKTVATDSVGRFAFRELKAGPYRLQANLIGYPPLYSLIQINDGELKDVEFRVDSAGQLLPTIFVEGEPQPELIRNLTTFERRQSAGHGRFITREDIVRRNPMRIMDMIRFLPGVRSDCRGFTCQIRLNQDPTGCPPAIFMDDQHTNIAVLDNTPPMDIEGLEIYRGPAETPPELNNEIARCGGAIVLWTRRGERRDR